MSEIRDLQEKIHTFVQARDWEKYHTPAELARAIGIEAGELNELFLWGNTWQARRIWGNNPDCESIADTYTQEISNELADVFIYCLALANVMGVDVADIIQAKMVKNGQKYPVAPRNRAERLGLSDDAMKMLAHLSDQQIRTQRCEDCETIMAVHSGGAWRFKVHAIRCEDCVAKLVELGESAAEARYVV